MDIQAHANELIQGRQSVARSSVQSKSSRALLEDIDALFDELPGEIRKAVFDVKSIRQDSFKDEANMDVSEGKISGRKGEQFDMESGESLSLTDEAMIDQDMEASIVDGDTNEAKEQDASSGNIYSKESNDAMDATNLYLREIGHVPLLTPEEELYYARLAVAGNERGRQRMIESNLRLVVKIARRYLNRGLPLLDLVEEGNLGLIHAVGKFDPEKGFRFSTYATWWIRQTIERALMSQVRTIRVPIHVMKELNQCLRAQRELSAKLRHEPTDMEVANLMGRPVEEVSRLLKLNEHITSLDVQIGEDGTLHLSDVVANEHEDDPQTLLCNEDMANHINRWLDHLNEKQREVIARRFGLDGYEKRTLQRVGEDVGLTRERVRQIQVEALAKLRRLMEQHGINRAVACVA